MTTALQLTGTVLTASADDRLVTYLLAPFGEPGRTNLGKVTLTASSLTVPEDVTALPVNVEHQPTTPVGKFARIEATDKGYEADVRFLATRAGDDALTEAREGVRTGISVEVDRPVIRSGRMLAGTLSGAGLCVRPAYPSAQMVAVDAGELPEGYEHLADTESASESSEEIVINGVTYVVKRTYNSTQETTPKNPEDTPSEDDDAEQSAGSENTMAASLTAAAAATAGVQTPHGGTTKDEKSAEEVFRLLASAFKTGGDTKLMAALTDITHDDGDGDGDGLGEITAAPAWLGEVYKKAAYQRKYIPLVTQGTLTSYREKGFRFLTQPTVAKYTGNKAEVPTGGMTAEDVDYTVQRWAHGADIDRRYIDFGDSDVLRAFVEAQVESYKKVTDVETLVNIIAAATEFTPGTVPTGINATISAIVDGALTLIGDDLTPTFAIVGSALYRDILLTPKDDVTEYLSSAFGFEDGSVGNFRIVPSGHANAVNQVVVGDGSTVRFKELGGGTPVRVEAENVANGGRDLAVFGYTSFQELDEDGLVFADLTPAG